MTRKIDMEKLKAVSPRMIEMIGLMNAREYDYHVPKELWPLWDAIAATMLKLAEEKQKQADKFLNFFKQMKANAKKAHSNIARVTVDLIDEIIEQLEAAHER